jgi:excisionase family DNA binding protein
VLLRRSQNEFITSREAANMLGVSLRTVQLWVESGVLKAWKTAGGHRRIATNSVKRLLDQQLVATSEDSSNEKVHRESDNRRLKVVVVEDEHVQLALYKIKFDEWGLPLELLTFTDSYQALLQIGIIKPDVVITDLNMPGMDGFRMIRALFDNPELKNMHVLAITGLTAEEIKDKGGLPENVAILSKPIPFEVIEVILRDRISSTRVQKSIDVKI